MPAVILRKLLRAGLTLWLVVTLTFVVLRASGDPAQVILGPEATPQTVEVFRHDWGLDRPIAVQYATYLGRVAGGDFGDSFLDHRPALTVVGERLPNTLRLAGLGFLLMLATGIPAGVLAALHRGRALDRAVVTLAVMWGTACRASSWRSC